MDYFDRNCSNREVLMRRYGKPLLVAAALLAALFLTIFRSGPVGTVLAGAEGPPRASADPAARSYDLTALHILNMTLVRIKDNYVDPTRIDPKGMLLKALDNVQKNVAEVLVEPHPEQNQVTVRVDVAQRTFNIEGVDSPWALSAKLREIFRFIQANLHSTSDTREIEYSAINGMLQTLDPHSLLLDPDSYAEMRIQTKGSFGGLGMTLSIRKNQLTIINVLTPVLDMPAGRAGFKAGDRIVRINEESTANMTLTEAVNRLRGEPGTKVTVWLERDGWKEPRRFAVTRDVIQVHSVESRVLHSPHGAVGYVKLKQFQGNSAEDLRRALRELHAKGVKGLVLDLRFNPGGLLDQAIKVADTFVETGTLVTTVGFAGKQREEKRASGNGIDPHTPMAVLVNGGSASASEIVAGALKNLDRAVIVGAPTFGKGSVQVLYDNDDNSALKLTIAQYLTPGDVSIQSVGIQPDVLTVPMRVPAQLKTWCDAISLYRTSHWMRESDLDQHLTSKGIRQGDKPLETVRYFDPPKPLTGAAAKAACEEREDDEGDPDEGEPPPPDDDKFVEDFDIQLARDLVAQAPTHHRRELLAQAKSFFARRRAEEADRTAQALQKLGIDWSSTPAGGPKPQLSAVVQTDKPQNQVRAGDLIRVRGTVKNAGPGVASQVVGKIESDDGLFKDRELVFGKIKAGESRNFELLVKVPKDAYTRVDPLKLTFREEHQAQVAPVELGVRITGLPRPLFAYSYQVLDDQGGNGNGLIEPGENIRMLVTVKNMGQGRSFKPQATLKNDSGEGVDIGKGRFEFNSLQPGESRTVDFTFKVAKDFRAPHVQITLAVVDRTLREIVSDKIKFPLVTDPPAEQPAAGAVTVTAAHGTDVRGGASAKSPVIGSAPRGAVFKQTGRFGDFARVELEAGRPGFIALANASQGGQVPAFAGPGAPLAYTPVLQVSPPRITLEPGDLETAAPTYHLRGEALDDTKVADMYVFIANRGAKVEWRKVAYRSNRNGHDARRMKFDLTIPLMPGVNQVTVFARQSDNVQARQTLIVTRTGGAQAKDGAPPAPRQAAGGGG
jgi:carboxyl-terminal processing protease